MPNPAIEKMKTDLQAKIKKLIEDFSAGTLSNEQFNIVYARYNAQLALAEQADEHHIQTSIETVAILNATQARALGLSIYHHRSGTTLETLGVFSVPADVLSPVLNDFSLRVEAREFIEPVQKRLPGGKWVVFIAREFTTTMVVFSNEPSKLQVRQMQRLQHDFEEANRRFLDKYTVNPTELARPFAGFVKEKTTANRPDTHS